MTTPKRNYFRAYGLDPTAQCRPKSCDRACLAHDDPSPRMGGSVRPTCLGLGLGEGLGFRAWGSWIRDYGTESLGGWGSGNRV